MPEIQSPIFILNYTQEDQKLEIYYSQENFLFSTASKLALGPTKPHVQKLPEAAYPRVKQQGRESDHSPPFSAEFKMDGDKSPFPPYAFME
jgi:hypothetical protein